MTIDSILHPNAQPTPAQIKAGQLAVLAVAEAIRELGEVPSGELYARLMGHLSLASYESILSILEGAGLIDNRSHLITWVGPKLEAK